MDETLLSKIRLSVVSELLTASWVSFTDLLATTGTTNGNLSTHLAKLLDAGYVKEDKSFIGRRPLTRYRLTSTGRRAFYAHVDHLQTLATASRSHRTS